MSSKSYAFNHNPTNLITTPATFYTLYDRTIQLDLRFSFNTDANNGTLCVPVATKGGTYNTTTCVNLACHNPCGSSYQAVWQVSAASCALCHADTTGNPLTGSHTGHLTRSAVFGRTLVCSDCHAVPGSMAHLNGTTEVQVRNTSGVFGGVAILKHAGACGTNECHNNGTTGAPLLWSLTESDLGRLGENERQSFGCAGIANKDTVLLAVTMDRCFMAGLAYWLGLRAIGCPGEEPGQGACWLSGIEGHAPTLRRRGPGGQASSRRRVRRTLGLP